MLTETTTAEALKEVFDANNISYNEADLILAEDTVKACQMNNLSAFKAAGEICTQMDLAVRFNRTQIERSLIKHQILN